MALHDGCWFDVRHSVEDLRPNSIKPYPEKLVGGEEPKLTRASPIRSAICCRRIMRKQGAKIASSPGLQPVGQIVDTWHEGRALRVGRSWSSRGTSAST